MDQQSGSRTYIAHIRPEEDQIMKKRFSEAQIAFALRQAASGTPVAEIVRKMGVTEQSFYRWKKHYGDLGVPEIRQLRQVEEENRRLKRLVADLTLDKQMLQDVLSKKL
jgi:putative transposase